MRPRGGKAAVQAEIGDVFEGMPTHRHTLGVGCRWRQFADRTGNHSGVGPAGMVIDEYADRVDFTRIDGSLFALLTHGRRQGVFAGVPCPAHHAPGVAFMSPRRAMLEHGVVAVDDEQSGSTEAAPVSMTRSAHCPAVT